ncbi:unnamed protein product [Psylliodes chrysocephalus]|uniref:Uncharacterized protein n=1 Tax=Psylliodes chrysocephalus TaxID=3402493 RepID=A0A9P0GJH5_9CUCU|nr:unnamed protein product [Psylliodes chrysocephala]
MKAKLKNVIRLGGFYLLMSIMGAMRGSAVLKYESPNAGHASVQSTCVNFVKLIMQEIDLSPDQYAGLEAILCDFDKSLLLGADQEECVKELASKFENHLVTWCNC